jgi:endonuclease/exonuclease/phosphatase family metal-dependent hydrolase
MTTPMPPITSRRPTHASRYRPSSAVTSALALVVLLISAGPACAALVLTDDFTYADGPLTSALNSPWVAHSAPGTGSVMVTSGKIALAYNNQEDVSASLSGQPYTAAGGAVLYARFTVNFSTVPSAGGGYFAHLISGSTFRALVWASTTGAPSGQFRLGIANTTGGSASSGQLGNNLSLNTTYTIVIRYNVGTGASTIWLNPSAESDPGVTASDSPNPVSIISFAFRQNSGMGILLVDDLRVGTAFTDVVPPSPNSPPIITSDPQSRLAAPGANVEFNVSAVGAAPLRYQWQRHQINLTGATNATLALAGITTNHAGDYRVIVTNAFGAATSAVATLIVDGSPPFPPGALSVLVYNVKGNNAADWSTNAPQVRAIGRKMSFLKPDVITFNEIPFPLSHEMTNFVTAFLPGYSLARNSGTDGYVRSVIASRFPITRSAKWLDGVSLTNFGFNGNFTRDLFEAQIAVPGFPQPLHVFTTHLRAGGTWTNAAQRAAEAGAISNYFVTGFLTTNALRPYILTGDLNEDILRPNSTNGLVQRLANAATGLQLTTPRNPFNNDDRTWSIQAASLSVRLDYVLPCGLLFSNITHSQVFRTDLLNPLPSAVQSLDSKTASDHLPVLMVFENPYAKPFQLTSLARSNQSVTLRWESVPGQSYRVEASPNLITWSMLSPNLLSTGATHTFTATLPDAQRFFRIYRLP